MIQVNEMGTRHEDAQKNHSINTPAKEAKQWWIKLKALVMLHLTTKKAGRYHLTDQSSRYPHGPDIPKTNQNYKPCVVQATKENPHPLKLNSKLLNG